MYTSYVLEFLSISSKISRKPQLTHGKRGRRDVPNEKERARRKKVRMRIFMSICIMNFIDSWIFRWIFPMVNRMLGLDI